MSNKKEFKLGEEIELPQEYIVLAIPDSTVEVTINANVYYDGEIHKVTRVMDFNEVRDAIKEAQDGYIPSDAIFSLTPLGEKRLNELQERYGDFD